MSIVLNDYWDVLRVANVALSIYLSVRMVAIYLKFDESVDKRMFRLAFAGLLVGDAIMTFQSLVTQEPGNATLLAITVPLVWLLAATHYAWFHDAKERLTRACSRRNQDQDKDSQHDS